ncbi:hypothetical protein BGZ73_000464 [Actinomortierella ambigua]|nr:hypothetical protein BGZ73_000464 [Actinomortierella ambigua]
MSTSSSPLPSAAVVPPSTSGPPLDPPLSSSSSSSSSSPAFSSPSLLPIFTIKFALFGIPLLAITLMMVNYASMTVACRQMVGDTNVHPDANSNEEKSATTNQAPVTTDDHHNLTWSQAWVSSLSPLLSWVAFRKITHREGYRVLLRGLGAENLGFLVAMAVFTSSFDMETIVGSKTL